VAKRESVGVGDRSANRPPSASFSVCFRPHSLGMPSYERPHLVGERLNFRNGSRGPLLPRGMDPCPPTTACFDDSSLRMVQTRWSGAGYQNPGSNSSTSLARGGPGARGPIEHEAAPSRASFIILTRSNTWAASPRRPTDRVARVGNTGTRARSAIRRRTLRLQHCLLPADNPLSHEAYSRWVKFADLLGALFPFGSTLGSHTAAGNGGVASGAAAGPPG